MSAEEAELLKEFAVESQEHLADIENQLLTLESQGDNMDVALVNTVFRAIHSIKGAAGFMGLDTLGGLAHRAEEVLGRLRSNELRPTGTVINTLLRATDRLKELIDEVESSNDQDVSDHISALEAILVGKELPCVATPSVSRASEELAASPSTESAQTSNATAAAPIVGRDFITDSLERLERLESDLRTLDRNSNSPGTAGSVLRNLQDIEQASTHLGHNQIANVLRAAIAIFSSIHNAKFSYDAQISEALAGAINTLRAGFYSIESNGHEGAGDLQFSADFLHAILSIRNTNAPDAGRDADSFVTQNVRESRDRTAINHDTELTLYQNNADPAMNFYSDTSTTTMPKSDFPLGAISRANSPMTAAASAHDKAGDSPKTPVADGSSTADSTIRVDVSLLDKLMTRVGELVLARNQILQFNSTLNDSALQNAVQRLNLITSELQEGVMKTRMQPIGNVWTKFPRLVRDLAAMCGKQVRIEMEGKETELDKTIIEAIKDPLTHLVRNTVDHGIEKPEVRCQLGKPAEGCLKLKAYHEGGQVNIEIDDDGGGLNTERIKAKAIEKGLITFDEASRMPDREVGNLIFLPGFSTAEKVSSVSGRGVGMDVVRTNIEKIGGTVDLQSQQGVGTVIKIKIPLTLAIIPALIVTADNDRYAIPQVNLLELVRLEDQINKPSIEWIHGAPVYRLRGQLLPLVSLRNELGLSDDKSAFRNDRLSIVVLRADDRQFGLIVDRINDSEEIVVKPLSKQLKNVPIYSGTTIMGDGRVALILDVMGLAYSSRVITGAKDRSPLEVTDAVSKKNDLVQTLLVLQVGKNRRFALPLSQVTRLEKIPANAIENAGHNEVVQYRGEILALIRLSSALGLQSDPLTNETLDVVVYTHGDRSIGLVVDQILDIVESELSVQRSTSQRGLRYSTVVQERVTDLLDLQSIIQMADPSFFDVPDQTRIA